MIHPVELDATPVTNVKGLFFILLQILRQLYLIVFVNHRNKAMTSKVLKCNDLFFPISRGSSKMKKPPFVWKFVRFSLQPDGGNLNLR